MLCPKDIRECALLVKINESENTLWGFQIHF
jgi:hypothetical protein